MNNLKSKEYIDSIKTILDKLYEQTKQGDAEHQTCLKNKFDTFYKTEILAESR